VSFIHSRTYRFFATPSLRIAPHLRPSTGKRRTNSIASGLRHELRKRNKGPGAAEASSNEVLARSGKRVPPCSCAELRNTFL